MDSTQPASHNPATAPKPHPSPSRSTHQRKALTVPPQVLESDRNVRHPCVSLLSGFGADRLVVWSVQGQAAGQEADPCGGEAPARIRPPCRGEAPTRMGAVAAHNCCPWHDAVCPMALRQGTAPVHPHAAEHRRLPERPVIDRAGQCRPGRSGERAIDAAGMRDLFSEEWSVLEVAYAVALDRQQPLPKAGDHDIAAARDALAH